MNIVIDGVEYAPVPAQGEEQRICIVDNRGLTLVGAVDLSGSDPMLTIKNARCIIRWGTSKHLAELGNGPLPDTQLGAALTAQVPRAGLVLSYKCRGNWDE